MKNLRFKLKRRDRKTTEKKYMILLVAGQSNAVGYDESIVKKDRFSRMNKKVFQLGFNDKDNLKIIPLGHCAQDFQDMRPYGNPKSHKKYLGTKGIHLPLGKLIANRLKNSYKVLIIPCAYGGTGFTTTEPFGKYDCIQMKPTEPIKLKWGVESAYYKALKDRLKFALDQNKNNKFLGVLWIQGENDIENPNEHIKKFNEMTQDFFEYFNDQGYGERTKNKSFNKNIWFNCETVNYWYDLIGGDILWKNYEDWNKETYIKIPRNADSNQINGTGLTTAFKASHFGNNSYGKVIAPTVFKKIIKNF